MLIEDLLAELRPIPLAYEQVAFYLEDNLEEIYAFLKNNSYEDEYSAIKGFLTANSALTKSLKDLVNEYQENVNKNFSQLLKNEI